METIEEGDWASGWCLLLEGDPSPISPQALSPSNVAAFFVHQTNTLLSHQHVACVCRFTLSNFYIQICKIYWNYCLIFLHLGNKIFRENGEEHLFITFLKEEFAVVSIYLSFNARRESAWSRTGLSSCCSSFAGLGFWKSHSPHNTSWKLLIYTMCRKKTYKQF